MKTLLSLTAETNNEGAGTTVTIKLDGEPLYDHYFDQYSHLSETAMTQYVVTDFASRLQHVLTEFGDTYVNDIACKDGPAA